MYLYRRSRRGLSRSSAVTRLTLALGALAAVFAVSVAVSSAAGGAGTAASAKKIVIGYSTGLTSHASQADGWVGAQQAAKQLGATIHGEFTDAVDTQLSQIQTLLASGITALVVDPNDSKAIGTSIKAANAAHIPVITFTNEDLGGGNVVSFLGPNEVAGTKTLAAYIFKNDLHGKGQIAIIQGDKAQTAGANREQGIREAMAEYPGIKLVAYGAAEWDPGMADTLAANMLTQHPQIAAILTVYDGMAQGVIAAVKAAHSHALISGVDGECPTLAAIYKGQIAATFDEDWRNIGSLGVTEGVAAAKGQHVAARVQTPAYVMTKQTMGQILAHKFPGETSILYSHVKAATTGCVGLGG